VKNRKRDKSLIKRGSRVKFRRRQKEINPNFCREKADQKKLKKKAQNLGSAVLGGSRKSVGLRGGSLHLAATEVCKVVGLTRGTQLNFPSVKGEGAEGDY